MSRIWQGEIIIGTAGEQYNLAYRYPKTADSLKEGLEETLTVHRLKRPGLLRQTLSSTNAMGSANSACMSVIRRVQRWRDDPSLRNCRFPGSGARFPKDQGLQADPCPAKRSGEIDGIRRLGYTGICLTKVLDASGPCCFFTMFHDGWDKLSNNVPSNRNTAACFISG